MSPRAPAATFAMNPRRMIVLGTCLPSRLCRSISDSGFLCQWRQQRRFAVRFKRSVGLTSLLTCSWRSLITSLTEGESSDHESCSMRARNEEGRRNVKRCKEESRYSSIEECLCEVDTAVSASHALLTNRSVNRLTTGGISHGHRPIAIGISIRLLTHQFMRKCNFHIR